MALPNIFRKLFKSNGYGPELKPEILPEIIATGATAPRYLGDRCADVVNAKDFGAVGDGVTDDTTAFTAAAATSDYVFVPGGTYSLSEDVSGGFFALDDVSITGAGGAVNGETKLYSLARLATPIGTVFWFSGSTVPLGSLLCNGAAISRTTYADLFDAIGGTYGNGDGSTTFNLPDLIDKFPQGSSTPGTVKSAGLPDISGAVTMRPNSRSNSSGGVGTSGYGAFSNIEIQAGGATGVVTVESTTKNGDFLKFYASNSNSIYGNSTTVQPPALTLLPCIKY